MKLFYLLLLMTVSCGAMETPDSDDECPRTASYQSADLNDVHSLAGLVEYLNHQVMQLWVELIDQKNCILEMGNSLKEHE